MKEQFGRVDLERITFNPCNPRGKKAYMGPEFEELVASIREKGVVQPILLRPHNGGYELVCGERRFRAMCKISKENGADPAANQIPAMIRKLTDDEAFEIMTIENHQRKDLSELEEARSFEAWLDRKGKESLPDLAERTGIHPRYIRRRVAVLGLPKQILKAWEKGDLKYGHLEQLCRLQDIKKIMEHFGRAVDYGLPVSQLKRNIDGEAPELKFAKFDLEKEGCLTCRQNSDVQKKLFGVAEMEKAHCLNPKCFKQKQNNWLLANWKKTGYRKQHGTSGFRFFEDVSWNEYESWWGSPRKECKECESFITLIDLTGSVYQGKACIGDKSCFNKREKTTTDPETGKRKPPAWHGSHFREKFFQERIPVKYKEFKADEEKPLRMLLLSLLLSNDELIEWFAKRHDLVEKEDEEDDFGYWGSPWMEPSEYFAPIAHMDRNQLLEELKEASLQVILQGRHGESTRRLVADHIDIDLAQEWQLNEEYLKKKTIAEMLRMGEELGVFSDKKAQTFLYEKLLKKRGSFKSCKKAELIRIFLESGVDLAGKVPAEILALDPGDDDG